jgi:drug/metabolite transporter (DMT)-like permease
MTRSRDIGDIRDPCSRNKHTVPHNNNHRRAVVLMLCALALLISLDACGKYLGGKGVPIAATTWSRYVGHLAVVLLLFFPRDGWGLFRAERPSFQWARGVLMLTVTLLYFAALKFIPLAEGTALFFLTPLITTGLSAWLLHERPTRWALAAVCLGFLGVLVVVRPGGDLPLIGMALVIAAAICNGCYQTLTRAASMSLTRPERTSTQLLFSGMVGALVMTLAIPFWWTPGWTETLATLTWIVFVLTGVFGAMGHLLLIRAYSLAPAPVIAPWAYMQLLLAIAIGWLVFDAVPDATTLVGMAIIGLSPQLTRLNRK